jgi:ubiquinone/menaquinone biosynthesis C-methylase UbiE
MSPPKSSSSEWGERARQLYDADYARRYRTADDDIRRGQLVTRFGTWLREVCESFGRDIAALDLGCGTGRYFWSLRRVHDLVGVDVSPAMLAQARQPVDAGTMTVGHVTLIEGDFLRLPFDSNRFDLVYSIGVLGEHVPLDPAIARRVHSWLRPGGKFAFTAVHRNSFSIPRTTRRRLAELAMGHVPSGLRQRLRERLLSGGLYVDEQYLGEILARTGFAVDSLEPHESDVHLHCMCVARKVTA